MKHNWEYKKLGEVATFTSGSRPTGGVRGITEGVLSLGGEHIGKDGFIDLTTPKYVSYEYYEANSKGHILDGDILLCKDGALTGKVALLHDELAGKKAMVNEHVFIIRTDSLYQPYLFRYLFSDFGQYELKSRIKGAAQGGLNGSNLRTIPIPLPPLPIQQKIVAELDKVSLIIDKKKQQLKELDKLAQAIFYDMFGDPVENEKGWDTCMLGDMCEIGSSKRIFAEEYTETGIPFYRGKEVSEKSKGQPTSIELYISSNRYAEIKDKYGVPKIGDILLTAVGTIGNIWVVDSDEPFYFKDGNVLWLQKKTEASSVYLKYLLEDLIEVYKKSMANGCAYNALTIMNLKKMPISIIPLSLQQSFAAKIEAIEKQKELISRSIKEAQTLFDERMDYWFD